MLWLALAFPRLPLEAGGDHDRSALTGTIIVERGRVRVVDDTARAAGLMPGMRLSTARGMLPDACIVERGAGLLEREARALDAFACFAGNITPHVCVEPPAALLLEVGGCLRFFGGLRAILGRLFDAGDERGLSVVAGIAPTPRAALWLARGQVDVLPADAPHAARIDGALAACALSIEAIPGLIGHLPIAVAGCSDDVAARLAGFGLRTLGDLLDLPRAALAQRVGTQLGEWLAQALADLPDPRAGFAFPERFRHAIELPGTVDDASRLAFPARRLLGDLCGWLALRQAGTIACTLHLIPERRGVPPVAVRLALSGPSRDAARFERVLREKLAQIALPAPIGDLVLEAGGEGEIDLVPLPGETPGLFDRRRPEVSLDALVERLRARFGDAAVHGLVAVPEHRPECATRAAAVGLPSPDPGPLPERPLWLLPEPEALPEVAGRPTRRGEPLELVGAPERIESGWWDEGERNAATARPTPGDVRRDYFFARTPAGQWWWIFRDARGWWGQGMGLSTTSKKIDATPPGRQAS